MNLKLCLKSAGSLYPDNITKQLRFISGWKAAANGWAIVPSSMDETEFMGYAMGKAMDPKKEQTA